MTPISALSAFAMPPPPSQRRYHLFKITEVAAHIFFVTRSSPFTWLINPEMPKFYPSGVPITDNDAGILVNAFGDAAYKFPGPAVSKLGSTSSDDVPADSDDSTKTDGTDEDTGSPSSSSPVPSSGTSKTSNKTKTPDQPSPSVAHPKKTTTFPPWKLPSMTLSTVACPETTHAPVVRFPHSTSPLAAEETGAARLISTLE